MHPNLPSSICLDFYRILSRFSEISEDGFAFRSDEICHVDIIENVAREEVRGHDAIALPIVPHCCLVFSSFNVD